MTAAYNHFVDLLQEVEPPADGTFSRTLHNDDRIKVVLFGFSAGQELTEHTASVPAILHWLSGKATLTLGPDSIDAVPGTWVHMAAGLPHAIRTETESVLLLIMLKSS